MSDFDTDNIEFYIVKQLLESDSFARSYIAKIQPELFSAKLADVVRGIVMYFKKFGKFPPAKVLEDVVIPQIVKNDEDLVKNAKAALQVISAMKIPAADITTFMADETKKFIKTRTIMNAFVKCVDLVPQHKHDDIVAIMENAFRVNFDESLGLNYFEDLEQRLARCALTHEVISTGLPTLDGLIGGGYRRKALFVFAGPGNVGKSLVLNDAASTLALAGYNVLYLSLELSEDYISQRTDAKFGDISMNSINADPEAAIKKVMAKRKVMMDDGRKLGQLIYKDYPPNVASCNDIRGLLKTLETKNGFKPDFLIIDYVKLVKPNGKVYGDNLYNKLGTVCEEMRALGIEYNACVLSASQTGRQSYGSASIGMEDVSDSIAIPQTADVLVTLARNETLNKDNSILLTLAKSRFSRNEGSMQARIDYDHMKLIDISEGSQANDMTNKKDFGVSPMPTSKKEKKPASAETTDFNLQL